MADQIQSGIAYNLGAAMKNQISFTESVIDQFNFPVYESLRLMDIKKIEDHLVNSGLPPKGNGVPSVQLPLR